MHLCCTQTTERHSEIRHVHGHLNNSWSNEMTEMRGRRLTGQDLDLDPKMRPEAAGMQNVSGAHDMTHHRKCFTQSLNFIVFSLSFRFVSVFNSFYKDELFYNRVKSND